MPGERGAAGTPGNKGEKVSSLPSVPVNRIGVTNQSITNRDS